MTLKEILQGILNGTLNYGEDKDYFFWLDHDGEVMLLKRNLEVTEDEEGHSPRGWSQYQDKIIWSTYAGKDRGIDITSQIFKALNIKFVD